MCAVRQRARGVAGAVVHATHGLVALSVAGGEGGQRVELRRATDRREVMRVELDGAKRVAMRIAGEFLAVADERGRALVIYGKTAISFEICASDRESGRSRYARSVALRLHLRIAPAQESSMVRRIHAAHHDGLRQRVAASGADQNIAEAAPTQRRERDVGSVQCRVAGDLFIGPPCGDHRVQRQRFARRVETHGDEASEDATEWRARRQVDAGAAGHPKRLARAPYE